jgi:hypothetical protein
MDFGLTLHVLIIELAASHTNRCTAALAARSLGGRTGFWTIEGTTRVLI